MNYYFYPNESLNDSFKSYAGNNSLNYDSISAFGLYDTDKNYVKLLCAKSSTILQCNFLKLIIKNDKNDFEYNFIGEKNLNFTI